ncbi:hypothetical protein G7Y89_g12844 [Cudoniella acicularis]|uniref:Adhesin domain-containing protein n=1 Tax=Cudoniella acicularis TaxID=354080 RepID=A0A8H4R8F8_9HELO|nr:hypothetical protein G7Y89_g12844 [Cudoniella acicularis]
MPSSDNLYSAEDSDGESFSNELSPTDGYFNGTNRTPQRMVQDPTFDDDKKPEAKTLIPTPTASSQASTGRTSRTSNYPALSQIISSGNYASHPSSEGGPSSPMTRSSIPHTSSRRTDRIFSENTPLMNDAPPAYTPSPPTSSSSQESQESNTYSTFPENHLENGFLPRREPESMGGPVDRPIEGPSERTPLSNNRRRSSPYRKLIKKLLFIAIVFSASIAMVTAVFHAKGSRPQKPSTDVPPSEERPIDASRSYCSSATIKNDQVVYEFPVGTDLTVLQTTHDNDKSNRVFRVDTKGEIRLRRLPKDSEHGSRPHFTVDVYVSNPDLRKVWFPNPGSATAIVARDTAQSAVLGTPDNAEDTIAKSGAVHPFSSRRVLVETVSGNIQGEYPLMDYLGLASQSGNIAVNVVPQAVALDAPAPAELEVQTASGTIKVDLPIDNPPPRNYITNVHSSSGTIDGTYYIGSLGSFKSTAGSITITALPVIQVLSSQYLDTTLEQSRFETHTVSGTTTIEVLSPISITLFSSSAEQSQPNQQQPRPDPYSPIGDDDPYLVIPPNNADRSLTTQTEKNLRNLQSKHTSNSASVSVHYPSAWEGSIHAKTVSGDIAVKGSGIRTIRERKGYAYKEVLARKGVEREGEGSMTEMSDIAGSLQFTVGDA